MNLKVTSGSNIKAKAKRSNSGFAFVPVTHILDEGDTEELIDEDAVLTIHNAAEFVLEGKLVPRSLMGGAVPVFVSSDTSKATVDSAGVITRVGNGVVDITSEAGKYRQRFSVTVGLYNPATVTSFKEWALGSLARHIQDTIDGMTEGRTVNAESLNVFTSQNHGTGVYERNPSLWCSDLVDSLTGFSVWNSVWGVTANANLITPQHVVGASHYGNPLPTGSTVRFVESENVTHERWIIASYVVPNPGGELPPTDITIGVLNEPLPPAIQPLLVPPGNIGNFLRKMEWGLSTAGENQFGEVRQFKLVYARENHSNDYNVAGYDTSDSPWFRLPVAGDSGGGSAVPVNGRLMIISHWTAALGGPGYWGWDWASEIAAADAAAGISTGYSPAVANLSSFTDFS